MPPELVIFDCDGVLVDSERLAVRVDAVALTRFGWRLSEAEVADRFMGRTQEYMEAEIEARLGDSLPEDWRRELDDLYRDAFERELRPVAGVVEALERIALPTCVASSGTHERIRLTLGLTGLLDRFEGRIFSAEEVASGKPEPDLFLHAAGALGAEPAACVVIEDSRWGVQAARRAGMAVLGYAGGLTPGTVLGDAGAVVFDRMRELPRLLAELDPLSSPGRAA